MLTALTSIVFQSSSSTFFMGKCGAFMLQNLVTMVKRSRAKGSPLYRGEPEGTQVRVRVSDVWPLFYELFGYSNLVFF